ncbi:hypothetical protein COOONC_03529, partial [Cooperia oncophora]
SGRNIVPVRLFFDTDPIGPPRKDTSEEFPKRVTSPSPDDKKVTQRVPVVNVNNSIQKESKPQLKEVKELKRTEPRLLNSGNTNLEPVTKEDLPRNKRFQMVVRLLINLEGASLHSPPDPSSLPHNLHGITVPIPVAGPTPANRTDTLPQLVSMPPLNTLKSFSSLKTPVDIATKRLPSPSPPHKKISQNRLIDENRRKSSGVLGLKGLLQARNQKQKFTQHHNGATPTFGTVDSDKIFRQPTPKGRQPLDRSQFIKTRPSKIDRSQKKNSVTQQTVSTPVTRKMVIVKKTHTGQQVFETAFKKAAKRKQIRENGYKKYQQMMFKSGRNIVPVRLFFDTDPIGPPRKDTSEEFPKRVTSPSPDDKKVTQRVPVVNVNNSIQKESKPQLKEVKELKRTEPRLLNSGNTNLEPVTKEDLPTPVDIATKRLPSPSPPHKKISQNRLIDENRRKSSGVLGLKGLLQARNQKQKFTQHHNGATPTFGTVDSDKIFRQPTPSRHTAWTGGQFIKTRPRDEWRRYWRPLEELDDQLEHSINRPRQRRNSGDRSKQCSNSCNDAKMGIINSSTTLPPKRIRLRAKPNHLVSNTPMSQNQQRGTATDMR